MKRLLTFARVDGDLVRVSVRGEGRPLLLIMGLGGNLEMWDPLEQELNARGIQTITYDAPGTGESPARLLPRRMPGLARQAAHLLDVLGLPRVDVLGVSFGGARGPGARPAQPAPRPAASSSPARRCGLGSVPGHPVALALLANPLRYYSPAFFRAHRAVPLRRGRRRQRPRAPAQIAARHARPPSLRGFAGQLTAAAGWSSLPWLHHLRAPTLVLAGDDDRIVPPVNARILAARIPDARLEMVPGGHLFLMEHPSDVRRADRRARAASRGLPRQQLTAIL